LARLGYQPACRKSDSSRSEIFLNFFGNRPFSDCFCHRLSVLWKYGLGEVQ
jgi:hypothetical protein